MAVLGQRDLKIWHSRCEFFPELPKIQEEDKNEGDLSTDTSGEENNEVVMKV